MADKNKERTTFGAAPETLASLLSLGLSDRGRQICKYALLCDIYKDAVKRARKGDEDGIIQVDEICNSATRYSQTCYKKMQDKQSGDKESPAMQRARRLAADAYADAVEGTHDLA
jgi:hypothetical protein